MLMLSLIHICLAGCLIDKACQLIDGLIMGWYQRMKACIGDGKRDIISAGMIYPTDMDDGVGGKLVVQEGHLVGGGNVVPVGSEMCIRDSLQRGPSDASGYSSANSGNPLSTVDRAGNPFLL